MGKITGRSPRVKPALWLLTFGGGGSMALFSSTSLEPGMAAPDFTLPDQGGKPVRLSHLRGKRVVLYFFPKADTPG
jgi:cytochrome oxidase Cu insertion factor (SCO1/SenC/PrrC family)